MTAMKEDLRYYGITVEVTINASIPANGMFVQRQHRPRQAYRVFASHALREDRIRMLIEESELRARLADVATTTTLTLHRIAP